MKKLIVLLIVAFGFTATTMAQAPKPQWVTIKSTNLKCWECKKLLDDYLHKVNGSMMESGMIQWRFNLLQGEIKVQFWPDRTNANVIKTAITNAGFDADEMKANPDYYKTLPPLCKRAEDGGGPSKGKPCHVEPQ